MIDEHTDFWNKEEFFKERGIRYQSVDLKEKGLSKGEFHAVMQAAGGLEDMAVIRKGTLRSARYDGRI